MEELDEYSGNRPHRHWDDFEIARLVDRIADGEVDLDADDPMLRCPRCVGILAELTRARLEHDYNAYDDQLPDWAQELLTREARSLKRPRRPRPRWAWATVAAVAVAAFLLFPSSSGRLDAREIEQARREQLAFPGYEGAYGRAPGPVMRSGIGSRATRLRAEMESLYSVHGADPPADIRKQLVARHLALGELEEAEPLLHQMQRDFPDDRDYRILRALAAYRRNEIGLAIRRLDELRDEDPHDPVVNYNLARLLYDDEDPRARSTLETLFEEHAEHPLADAARRIRAAGDGDAPAGRD